MPSSRYYKFKEVSYKEKIKKIKFLFFSIGVLGLLLSIIWAVFLSPLFKIKDINIISDSDYLNHNDIIKIMSDVAPFGLKENLIFLSKFKLKSELTATFPAITNVTIKKDLFNTLIINFKKRISIGIWCHHVVDEPQANNCYYFDNEGIIFALAPQTEGSLILKIMDFSKNNVSLGNKVLDSNRINFVINFSNEINENGKFKILEFKIKPNSSVNFEAITDKNWSIYLDDTQDVKIAANNLLTILDEAVKKTGNLEYIDLRIPSRIFYKLK